MTRNSVYQPKDQMPSATRIWVDPAPSLPFTYRIKASAPRLEQVPPDKLVVQGLAQPRRRPLHDDARALQRLDLGIRAAFPSRHDGARVAHPPAGRRRDSGNEADDGLP